MNIDSFSQAQLDAIYAANSHHIELFGYQKYFEKVSQNVKDDYKPSGQILLDHNKRMIARAVEAIKAPDYVIEHSIAVNHVPDLIRPYKDQDP